MIRAPDTLRVTTRTSLDELQRFADAAGDKAKIRGRQNADGSITLYASTMTGTGLDNLIHGKRIEHQNAARQAVSMVLRGVGGGQLDVATNNILAKLPQGELRGARLAALAEEAQTTRANAAMAPRSRRDIAASLHEAIPTG